MLQRDVPFRSATGAGFGVVGRLFAVDLYPDAIALGDDFVGVPGIGGDGRFPHHLQAKERTGLVRLAGADADLCLVVADDGQGLAGSEVDAAVAGGVDLDLGPEVEVAEVVAVAHQVIRRAFTGQGALDDLPATDAAAGAGPAGQVLAVEQRHRTGVGANGRSTRFHPLRPDDLAVMPVAGGVPEHVVLPLVEVVQGKRLGVGRKSPARREVLAVLAVAGDPGNANFVNGAGEKAVQAPRKGQVRPPDQKPVRPLWVLVRHADRRGGCPFAIHVQPRLLAVPDPRDVDQALAAGRDVGTGRKVLGLLKTVEPPRSLVP